ncbi:MAG: hypothetical protein WC375_09705 [Methanomassiliicoccales archaeon]
MVDGVNSKSSHRYHLQGLYNMGDYVKGQRTGSNFQEVQVNNTTVDVNEIANAVAKAIGQIVVQVPSYGMTNSINGVTDDFIPQDSMAKIADAMTVQRSNSESNFKDLGGVKKIKKNEQEMKKTLDMLKGLDN